MTAIHEYRCDACGVRVEAKWNREHWLPPQGWMRLVDANLEVTKGEVCPKCIAKLWPKQAEVKRK